jgi:hypothetical protein
MVSSTSIEIWGRNPDELFTLIKKKMITFQEDRKEAQIKVSENTAI